MMNINNLQNRLSQIRESLLSENWILVGSSGCNVLSFRHPRNGNRMTVIADDGYIFYIKNGVIVKREAKK